jgi:hypothetical protein
MSNARALFDAHWLLALGIVVTFVGLLLAVRLIRRNRAAVTSTWIAFLGSLSTIIGFAWDSASHLQGTESPIGHSLSYAGALLVILALPSALIFSRRSGQHHA